MNSFARSVVPVLFVGFLATLTPLDSLAKGKTKEPEPSKEEKKQLPADKHFPEIPSLKLLTPQEYFAIGQLIQLVILDDIGKGPKGPRVINGKQSRKLFYALGPESMPLMVQAMNYATQQSWTCPMRLLGGKLARFAEQAGNQLDLDFLEYAHGNLGRGVTIEKPFEQFMEIKTVTKGQISNVKKELALKYKSMDLSELKEKADAYQKAPSTRHAAWRFMIANIPERKDKLECVDILFSAMENSNTPTERKVLHAALVKIAGVDHGPKDFESLGSTRTALSKWREWHKEQK